MYDLCESKEQMCEITESGGMRQMLKIAESMRYERARHSKTEVT